MKKLTVFTAILIALLLAVFSPVIPVNAQPEVWFGTVKMRADAEVPLFGSATVRKPIILTNKGDAPAIISLSASGIEASFEENDFELGPGVQKTVYALVKVKEGSHNGKIVIKVAEGSAVAGIGSKILTSFVIEVVTVGTRGGLSLPLVIAIAVVVIGGITSFVLLRRRRAAF